MNSMIKMQLFMPDKPLLVGFILHKCCTITTQKDNNTHCPPNNKQPKKILFFQLPLLETATFQQKKL